MIESAPINSAFEAEVTREGSAEVKAESRKRVGELRNQLSTKRAKLLSTSEALRKSYRQMVFDEKAKEADEKLSEVPPLRLIKLEVCSRLSLSLRGCEVSISFSPEGLFPRLRGLRIFVRILQQLHDVHKL